LLTAIALSRKPPPIVYKGRSLGVVILAAAQILIGAIHVVSGLLLLIFENMVSIQPTIAYGIYTFVFGLLVLVFTVYIWRGKKEGWVGTILVSLFVIVVDSLAFLDLPSIPGVPKSPALAEIGYSVLIIGYLCTGQVRKKYLSSA
jgi:hypothetical protein